MIHATGLPRTKRAFVDHSIAIVIEAVADFGARSDETHTRRACLRPHLALAISTIIQTTRRSRRHTRHRRNVVDIAIAIVIGAVAYFSTRSNRPHARPTRRPRTRQCALVARRRQRTIARASSTLRRTPAQRPECTAVSRQRPTAVLSCWWSIRQLAFVGLTIAIVVNAVANLVLRQNRTLANDISGHARRGSGHTRRRRITAGSAKTRDSFVNLAVAIVVLVVARFGRRSNRPYTRTHTIGALNGASDAFARIRATRHTRQIFIGLAIAIVVDAIANFRRRPFGILTNPTTSHASERSAIARCSERSIAITRSARRRTPIDAPERTAIASDCPATIHPRRRTIGERRFVRLSVAIVIEVVAGFRRRAYATLTNQRAIDTRRRSRGTLTRGRTTLLPDARHAFIDLSVAIIVDSIANFGARSNEPDALHRSTRLRTLPTLTRRPVHKPARRSHRDTCRRRNAFVRLAVAIVIDVVTYFRLRIVRTSSVRIARNTGSLHSTRIRFLRTRQRTRTIGRGRKTTSHRSDAFIDESIAIVVATIAHFRRRNTSGTHAFIDDTITIVVLTIACFGNGTMCWTATLRHAFVDTSAAVVIDVIANFLRIVTQPVRRLRLLCRRRARKQGHVTRRIRGRNRRRIIRQTIVPLRLRGPRATGLSRIAIMRKPFVRTPIAIVVRIVARLRRYAGPNNRRKSLRKLNFVRREIRRSRPTRRRNRIRIRLITTRKVNDVRLDLERIRPNRHTRIEQYVRRTHRIRLRITRFVTVSEQNDVDRTTRAIIRTKWRGKCNRRVVWIGPARLKIPPHVPERSIQRRATIRRTIRRRIRDLQVARTVIVDVIENLVDIARTRRRTPKIILLHSDQNRRSMARRRIRSVIHRTTKRTNAGRIDFRLITVWNTRRLREAQIIPVTARPATCHVACVLRQTKIHLARKCQHGVLHRTLRMAHTRRRIPTRRRRPRNRRDHRPRRVHQQHEVRLRRLRPHRRIRIQTRRRLLRPSRVCQGHPRERHRCQ